MLKVNGEPVEAEEFAYDGCHKFFLIADDEDRQAAEYWGYEGRCTNENGDYLMHATVLVAIPGDTSPAALRARLEEIMERYDEQREVELHRSTSPYAEPRDVQLAKAKAWDKSPNNHRRGKCVGLSETTPSCGGGATARRLTRTGGHSPQPIPRASGTGGLSVGAGAGQWSSRRVPRTGR